MRKLFLLFAAFSLIAACDSSSSEEAGFTVHGTIENGKGKELLLNMLGAKQMEPIDTVTVAEDGSFKFTGKTKNPEFFAVGFLNSNEFITLVVDSVSNIEIKTDTANFAKDYTVSGSEGSLGLQNLNKQMEKTMTKIDSLSQIYRENMGKDGFDSIQARIDAEYKQVIEDHKKFSKNFIDNNLKSLASLIALSQRVGPQSPVLTLQEDEEYFNKVDETLFALYPNSQAVKSLHDYLEKVKRQKEAAAGGGGGGIKVGAEAPDISQPTPDGKELALSSLRGNYVLLDFWAAWCKPCRIENPNLVKNYNKYKGKGFTIYQVSLDQTKEQWEKAIKDDNLGAWHHVSDLKYWNSAPAKKYGVRSIPANYLLDPDGKIIASNLRGESLGSKLKEIYGF